MTAIGRLTGNNGDFLHTAGAHYLISDLTELPPILDKL
jgi:phosphoglycolate phosphatase-like HAD superfamily hydrolase